MAATHFVAFLISSFCIQWTLSKGTGIFHIYSGKCEDMDHNVVLNFSNVGFTQIADNLVSSPDVTCLSLSNNEIADVSDRAFDLLPNLSYLDVSNNYIERLFCVGSGTNITTLVLDNNVIRNPYGDPYYNGGYYDQPAAGRKCSLDFPNLKHIYARGCNVNTNNMAYLHAPKLTHLYLSSNHIDSLVFLDSLLVNATHLYLDRNDISKSEHSRLGSIVHLDLSFNDIQYLCNDFCNDMGMSLCGATNLQYLFLTGNKIANIEVDTFDDMLNLTVLDLSSNRIIGFKKGTFDSLNLLQKLSLSHNYLKVVPEINQLWSLTNLNLSFNDIETISSMRIAHNAELQSIDLSNNKISSLAADTFVNLTSLEYLNLSENKLQTVSQNWTAPLSNLKILHIGGNHIKNLASFHLSGATALTDVYLEKNFITVVKAIDMYNIPLNVSLHFAIQRHDSNRIC